MEQEVKIPEEINPHPERKDNTEAGVESTSLEAQFLESAKDALSGKMSGILVRESGSLRLFNAEQTLMYEGYRPEQEYLKGLICTVESGEVRVVAPCFPKFYNLGEKPENDQNFYRVIQAEGSVINFPEKIDGTNIRLYVNPDTRVISAATRGMIDGGKNDDEEGFGEAANIHYGKESLNIAREQFPKILNPDLLDRYTPVFELIHPENRIVTDYGDRQDLVLLAVFDKAEGCRELTRAELEEFAQQYSLNLVGTLKIDKNSWDNALQQLHQLWEGTDQEGTVVTVESGGEIAFRIKVKSPEYLRIMRVMKYCTLKRTEELADLWGTVVWEVFKEKLHEKHPDLPEEVVMGYEVHFKSYEQYMDHIQSQAKEIADAYSQFILENEGKIENQKDFALSIQQRPDKSFFFLIRKFGLENSDEWRPKMIEQLRKKLTLNDFIGSEK